MPKTCPQCAAVYRDGFDSCSDCSAPLLEESTKHEDGGPKHIGNRFLQERLPEFLCHPRIIVKRLVVIAAFVVVLSGEKGLLELTGVRPRNFKIAFVVFVAGFSVWRYFRKSQRPMGKRSQIDMTLKEPFPFKYIPPPKRHPFVGLLLITLGWFPFCAWTIFLFFFYVFLDSSTYHVTPLLIILLLGPLMRMLIKRGRAMRQLDAITLLKRDSRPPVLYLRSFDDDHLPDEEHTKSYDISLETNETRICNILNCLGPVVSLGRQNERSPEAGSARLYVPDSEWQAAVKYFLSRAAAVVLIVGVTEGVTWEIQTALRLVNPERLLFFFPFALAMRFSSSRTRETMLEERQQKYEHFQEQVGEILGCELPLLPDNGSALDFMKDGKPRLLENKRPFWGYGARIFFTNYGESFRPFIEKHLGKA